MIKYCGSCKEAAHESGATSDILDTALGEMGADIMDHDCDEVVGDGGKCACACH